MRSKRTGKFPLAGFLSSLLILAFAAPSSAQFATSLLNEDDPFPDGGVGATISGLNNTAVNHAGGYAISLTSTGPATLSHVWGNAAGGPGATIRTEGTFGSLVQTSYESFYGISNAGQVAYSASGTGGPVGGFDSVWLDDTPVMVEGDVYPHAPGTWWRFGSRPGVSADGNPYFVGGLTSTQGGSTENYGLFFGPTGAPVFVGGDALPGLPELLDTASTISFDYRFSAFASAYIGEVKMDVLSTSADNAMVLAGAGLVLGGTLVQEGNLIPVAVGGDGTENWDNFDYTGVTESGHWFFTGDTDGATATDEIIVKDGIILYREGDPLGGEVLSGALEGAYMNEDGDLAFIWDVQDNALEALFLNGQLLLKDGDSVDLTGDGLVDAGTAISSFTGISTLSMSDRDGGGSVNIYFTADIDTAGTSSTTDDIEGFYCMTVNLGPTAITLSGLRALPDLRTPGVTVEWSTSSEADHDGFHVYRSNSLNGPWDRLTSDLVRGQSPYSYRDTRVQPNSTYYYRIGAVDFSANEVMYGPVEASTPSWGFQTRLALAKPNPFHRDTEIAFSLARDTHARLTIFDVTGRQIATLVDQELPAGNHAYSWDGRTSDNLVTAGGVYFYRLETPELSETHKVVQLRQN
ncbi:T9SS type A sorting domain-containing protein [bacterium]|nr:T9SS type A sorting domain-containing protein [bacterium]